MDFKKYKSIVNSYKSDVEYLRSVLRNFNKEDEQFFVSEKVHGGNLGIYYSPKEDPKIKYATRNQFTDSKQIEDVIYKYNIEETMDYIFNYVKENIDSEIEYIILYSELYGGSYNLSDVKPDKNSKRIQKGVYYTPTNELYPFDIFVPKGENEGNVIGYYINGEDFLKIMNNIKDFSTIPNYEYNLFTGNLEECLNYNIEFDSKIPNVFGLPPIEDNLCEGVVIKPLRGNELSKFFKENDINLGYIYIKNKNEKFIERYKKPKNKKTHKDRGKKVQPYLLDIENYITENRVINVKSHYENLKGENKNNFMREFVEDVLNDCISDKVFNIHELEDKEIKIIKKFITNQLFKKHKSLILKEM